MTNLTDHGQNPGARRGSRLVNGIRIIYLLLAGLFAIGITLQVFFAGAGVLVNPSYFALHSSFGHMLELLPMLMVIVGLAGRLTWRQLGLTVLLFVLFMLQYVFLYGLAPATGLPVVRAFHAVNALALFWVGLYLTSSTWKLLRTSPRIAQPSPAPSIA